MTHWTAEDSLEFHLQYWREKAETYGGSDKEWEREQARLCKGYAWAFETALEAVSRFPTRREANVPA